MSTRTKYIVWIRCRRDDAGNLIEPQDRIWEEQGDGPLGIKTAERIARELRADFGCNAKVLPVGAYPVTP